MLNIENELLDNLKIEAILPIDNESVEVLNLLQKYNLVQDITLLNTIESQYDTLTKYLILLYLNDKEISSDIKSFILNSNSYKVHLLDVIQSRMKKIVNESSSQFFKEIYIILNLLSNTNKYKLLTDDNKFSIPHIQTLLKDYEDNICESYIKEDFPLYQIWFKYYLTLLEVLDIICIINSLDIQRRKNVSKLLELITSTIANTKNKIKLPDSDIKDLNAILGKQLLYFTNITYIPIDNNNKDTVIQKYAFMAKKVFDGFKLLNQEEKYYLTFLDNFTSLILTLIYKLKTKLHIKDINFEDSKDLSEIYHIYSKNVKEEQKVEAKTLNDFQSKLLSNYKYLYTHTVENINLDNKTLIEAFIQKKIISSLDMVLVYNIVLYSEELNKQILDDLLEKLLNTQKFDNDYYEFYKLKIIDRILQKYISLRISTESNTYIKDIIKYIEKNNTVSHLMSMYSKIYLSLSLYFSYEKTISSQEQSKNYYFIYKRLDSNNFLESEFSTISKQILYNTATNYIKHFDFRTVKQFTNSESIELGKDIIKKFIKRKDLEIKEESNKYVQNLIQKILTMNEPNENWLNKNIEKLISEKIFLGIASAKVKNIQVNSMSLEVGYEIESIHIYEDYYLVLSYSSYYKVLFEKILEKNREFLELNIKNIFISYLNSIPSYSDVITNLPNMNKLKNILKELDNKEIVFFEVYLDSIVKFSESYNVKISNDFFKTVANKINEEMNSYRLFGPKLGIIYDENKDYKELVSFLQNLKVQYQDEEFEIKTTIAVSFGTASNILDKSFYALSSAKIANDKLYVYR